MTNFANGNVAINKIYTDFPDTSMKISSVIY